jgi:ATP-dependent DNA helicase RecG
VAFQPNDHLIALANHLIPLKNQFLGDKKTEAEKGDEANPDLSTEQVRPSTPDLATEQVKPLTSLTDKQRVLLKYCDVPRTMAEIMEHLNVGSRGYLKNNHLFPLLNHGLLAMTNPEKPRASNQRYVITELGAELKQSFITTQDK